MQSDVDHNNQKQPNITFKLSRGSWLKISEYFEKN